MPQASSCMFAGLHKIALFRGTDRKDDTRKTRSVNNRRQEHGMGPIGTQTHVTCSTHVRVSRRGRHRHPRIMSKVSSSIKASVDV